MRNILWLITLAIFSAVLIILCKGSVLVILDLPALLFLVMLLFTVLCFSGLIKDFFRAFSMTGRLKNDVTLAQLKRSLEALNLAISSVIAGSLFTAIAGVMFMLSDIADMAKLGQNLAISLLILLYAAFIVLLLLPLRSHIRLLITDFMSKGS